MPWVKGKSGNPGGRPKAVMDVVLAARTHSSAAIRTLAAIMGDAEAPPAARAMAANSLLDRGWGKPVQPMGLAANDPTTMTDDELEAIASSGRTIAPATSAEKSARLVH